MAGRLTRLGAALLCALLVHAVVLWVIGREIQAITSVLQVAPDPLFTRLITQQGSAPAPAPSTAAQPSAKPPSRAKPAAAAPSAVQNNTSAVALPSSPTSTVATLPAAETWTTSQSTAQADVVAATQTTAVQSTTATIATAVSSPAGTGTADATAALTQTGQWPSDTRLSYELGGFFRGQLHGTAQVQWSRLANTPTAAIELVNADRYQVRVSINVGPTGAQLTSQGLIRADGLQPTVYEEQLPGGARRSAVLDSAGVVLHNGTRLPRPLFEPFAVQDSASQFVDIGHRFAQGRARLVAGETLRIWLARPGGMDEWVYDIGPAETLYLPILGAVQAHHLKPRPLAVARGTITAEMWIAPSLQYLPVRVKVNINSETHVDLLVKTIEQR